MYIPKPHLTVKAGETRGLSGTIHHRLIWKFKILACQILNFQDVVYQILNIQDKEIQDLVSLILLNIKDLEIKDLSCQILNIL